MAKKSSIEKNNRRAKMAKQTAAKRARLKAIINDKKKPLEERFAATLKLAQEPRNASPTRFRNRCEMTGRPRSVYRKTQLSRIAMRELGLKGLVPGGSKGKRGPRTDNRQFLNALLWMARASGGVTYPPGLGITLRSSGAIAAGSRWRSGGHV